MKRKIQKIEAAFRNDRFAFFFAFAKAKRDMIRCGLPASMMQIL